MKVQIEKLKVRDQTCYVVRIKSGYHEGELIEQGVVPLRSLSRPALVSWLQVTGYEILNPIEEQEMEQNLGLDAARVSFNWGFHDGTLEAANAADGGAPVRNMQKHFDSMYAIAYLMGVKFYKEKNFRPNTSSEAWSEYCALVGIQWNDV